MASAKDQRAAAAACNSDAENKKPGLSRTALILSTLRCFFDGTGNNKKVREKNKRLSNPARI